MLLFLKETMSISSFALVSAPKCFFRDLKISHQAITFVYSKRQIHCSGMADLGWWGHQLAMCDQETGRTVMEKKTTEAKRDPAAEKGKGQRWRPSPGRSQSPGQNWGGRERPGGGSSGDRMIKGSLPVMEKTSEWGEKRRKKGERQKQGESRKC